MNYRRRTEGEETRTRLLNWTRHQKASERLAAHLLSSDGYTSIDPSQPLGGSDNLKDIVCIKDDKKWVVGVYFPNGQQTIGKIIRKFEHDIQGLKVNEADGFVFFTNQHITNAQKKKIETKSPTQLLDIYQLEKITHLLDQPNNYGIRLDFLDIEMTKEEQLSFFSTLSLQMADLKKIYTSLKSELNTAHISPQVSQELFDLEFRLSNVTSMLPLHDLVSEIHSIKVSLAELEYDGSVIGIELQLQALRDEIRIIKNDLLLLQQNELNLLIFDVDRLITKMLELKSLKESLKI